MGRRENIESLVIEKLTQLENGYLENSPSAKSLALGFLEIPEFVELYENYKRTLK